MDHMDIENSDDICVIYCTAPPEESKQIAGELLGKNLVACVNITPVNSVYRWKGEVCNDMEDLLIIKTTREKLQELTETIVNIHPYEIPEVIALPVIGGYSGYIAWVKGEVSGDSQN